MCLFEYIQDTLDASLFTQACSEINDLVNMNATMDPQFYIRLQVVSPFLENSCCRALATYGNMWDVHLMTIPRQVDILGTFVLFDPGIDTQARR